MQLSDFKDLISAIPVCQHSVNVKKGKWNIHGQKATIQKIFGHLKVITISRNDLFKTVDIDEFIVKTLMWGYPTGGRGNNITKVLEETNFRKLVKLLQQYRNDNVTLEELKRDIKTIKGVNLSTMSKLLHFLKINVNDETALILDQKIINIISNNRFVELHPLIGIKYNKAIDRYVEYLKTINQLATKIQVLADQIELFLFMFGLNLSDANYERKMK